MSNWITGFAQHRIKIADALKNGALDAGYPEATIILLAVLSGIAAIIWPGKNKDRRRFVELLARHAPTNLQTQYVSTAMLVQEWSLSLDPRLRSAAQAVGKKYLPHIHTLIITGNDADGTEDIILQECPQLTPREVREFSYANLLYREIRCGLMHAYSIGPSATSHPMTDRQPQISYTNVTDPGKSPHHYKQIHFHFAWVRKLVSSVASFADKLGTSLPMADPSTWWIDG